MITEITKHVELRMLRDDQMTSIDHVFRQAFGTQLKHPCPEQFAPGRSCRAGWFVEPDGAFGAFSGDELIGFSFSRILGSVGVFGPLCVLPEFWSNGIGQLLLTRSIEFFDNGGVTDAGLCTFADSPKHISLYKKFGFHPRSLFAMMSRLAPSPTDIPPVVALFSKLDTAEKQIVVNQCDEITQAIYQGFKVGRESAVLDALSAGDTVLLREGAMLTAFANCHFGPGSEAENDVLYIKFAAVRPGSDPEAAFRKLLQHCLELAQARGLNMLFCGVNTARQEAFEAMLAAGFKIDSTSVAMHRPNSESYNRAGVFVLDDWR